MASWLPAVLRQTRAGGTITAFDRTWSTHPSRDSGWVLSRARRGTST